MHHTVFDARIASFYGVMHPLCDSVSFIPVSYTHLDVYKRQDLMKQRIADINPNARVITFETFVLPENIDEVLPEGIDYIIDAIDTVSAKLALAQAAWQRQTPIISCMGTGNKLHAQLFEIADIYETSVCPLCRVMRKELKARGIPRLKVLYSREQPLPARIMSEENTSKRAVPGSVSFVPPVAGLLIAGEAIRDVLNIPCLLYTSRCV